MLAQITDALRRGDLAAALAHSRDFAAAEPGNAAAHHLLGLTLLQSGDRKAARVALEQASELAPDHAEISFALANLLLSEGNTPAAIRRLHDTVSLNPNQLGSYVILMHLALARGDRAEAARNLTLAQRVDAEHPQVWVAEGHLAQADGNTEQAIKCFTAAVKAQPELAPAHLALGHAYLAQGLWPFAEKAFENAMALNPKRAPKHLRALIEARRRQGKSAETVQALDELLTWQPDDLNARGLRADLLAELGRDEAALADQLHFLQRHPTHARFVRNAALQLVRGGRVEEAEQLAEAALAQAQNDDELWLARLAVTGAIGQDPGPTLERWIAANPTSGHALDMMAGYQQALGNIAAARLFATRALQQQPQLPNSSTVKMREELETDPAAALARIEGLLANNDNPLQRRHLIGWTGLALDALERPAEAAARWREMVRTADAGLAPSAPQPAERAPAGDCPATLMYSPPGVAAGYLLRTLQLQLGERLGTDRIGSPAVGDGFNLVRPDPGHAMAGTAARWRQLADAAKIDVDTLVDWLPFVDGYTFRALGGARVIALLTDPRDALLNWLVFGCLQNVGFSPVPARSAQWLAASLEALADLRDAEPGRVHLVRLDRDAGKAEAMLEKLLDLPQPLTALYGGDPTLPAGRWRAYAEAFAEEFAILAPVAARLGYPAD